MLPTTGFFKDIDCPYYETSCERPYCHFKHRKKIQDPGEVTAAAPAPDVPTYNPTPKSQLANSRSHIPISYVPDLAVPKERSSLRSHSLYGFGDKPTYNPTPLSMLSTGKDKEAPNKLNEGTKVEEYKPPFIFQDSSNDFDFEDLKTEFDMIDEIMHDSGTDNAVNGESESTEDEKSTKVEKVEEKPESKHKSREKAKSDKKEETHRKSKDSHSKSKSKSEKDAHKKHKSLKLKDEKKSEKKERNKRSSSSEKKDSKDRQKHSKEKDRHKHKKQSKERDKEKKSCSSSSSKHEEESERKPNKEKSNGTKIEEKISSYHSDSADDCDMLINDDCLYQDSDEEDTLKECYKIFTEYKPTEPDIFADLQDDQPEVNKEKEYVPYPARKRIAHTNPSNNQAKAVFNKPKAIVTAAQAMINRMKAARLAHEQDNFIDEINKHLLLKRPAETPAVSEPKKPQKIVKKAAVEKSRPSTSSCVIDDILSGKSTNSKPKRIAPVQNVGSIQRAKARLQEMAKMRAIAATKTPVQSLGKGAKRVAHVPEATVVNVPDVLEAERSKLPVNVRSRFLKMIVDECAKLYIDADEAQQRALSEEFKCYERCSALVTYKNSAMLAISRLRKELQERDLAGLGPIFPGETSSSAKDEKCELKGRRFYENIKRFILTDEELTLHGFPREGKTPGRAVMKSQRKVQSKGYFSGENDRICCRCCKIYKVDKDGFALYEEECLYHPLKKRTFRGESIYLCCKSNSDIGCVTSSTHVSDTVYPDDAEIEGFQKTMPSEAEDDPRGFEVFALDCEMCYTTKGLELTRVTIVNSECKTVYESLVKPLNSIIDYNTRFSGITEEQMNRTATSILQVQANILHLCNSNTILIGHSLESDMKALKIIHNTIIDTSVLFPHKMGLPHKRALRELAREHLKKIIQNDISGHDSAEDALTCMELVQWKLKEEFKARGIKV